MNMMSIQLQKQQQYFISSVFFTYRYEMNSGWAPEISLWANLVGVPIEQNFYKPNKSEKQCR